MDIICYLSNGFPSLAESHEIALAYAEAGANIIEVDFPSKDPYLESDLIAGRMKKALEACGDYKKYMEAIVALKEQLPNTKILVLAYENTIQDIGIDAFIDFCVNNQLKDILLVGLQNEWVKERLIESGLQVSCYVQFHMPEEEIESAKRSNGFVYLQAKPYADQMVNELYPTLKDCVKHLRDRGIERNIYCGVGVHAPEDVRTVKEAGGDAAFVGSAILKLYDNLPEMKATIKVFKAQC